MEAQYNKRVAELKCQYEKILLKNEEDLAALKKFKKESDLVTGQLMFDADVKLKRELDRLSKQHESKLTKTQNDLEKDHLREIERMKKNHHGEIEKASNQHLREIERMKKKHLGELEKAANLVERLRRGKKEQTERHDKKIEELKQEKSEVKKDTARTQKNPKQLYVITKKMSRSMKKWHWVLIMREIPKRDNQIKTKSVPKK